LFAHVLDRGLVGKEVAAIDRVVEVRPGGVSLPLEIFGGVDASLRADGVRALDRDDRKEIDFAAGLGDLDNCGEPGETTPDFDLEPIFVHPTLRDRAA
jgi:hypothetical protein